MLGIQDESFYDKYELFGCIQCGKCTGGCPVSLNSPLNVRRLMHEALVLNELKTVYEKDELWACSACKTCTIRCPRELRPADLIVGMRTALIEEGHIPKTVIDALESAYKYGNPWGAVKNKRTEWAEGLELKVLSQGAEAEHLYFVCCTAAYDTRVQDVARSTVKCLQKMGVDFSVLGNDEVCCGSEIRRMGEEGLFEMLLEQNMESFNSHAVRSIITTSPHCYNAIKTEYGQEDITVRHYTQVLAEAIERDPPFSKELQKVVTYHDPCFLGKQNGVFEEPRQVLEAIPGVTFIDFDRSREKSLCCEGGGGRMWVEASDQGPRSAEIRVRDAVEMGAEILATACPFCLLTLEDAVKTTGNEERLRVMDITEILVETL
jgi:Fe-S oxidoreductase